ncbi:MAG TPA: tetratricopeptide repeat protein [Pirellulaceae bacterium]|nr:tetratricopeptide repeat protein [Pirellulaceae bacterium]
MKAERRHELQQNELADWLGEKIEALKPQATQIAIVVLAVVVLVVAGTWYFGTEDHASARSWSDFFGAMNQPRDSEKLLEKLSIDKPGTAPGMWAMMTLADTSAEQGGRAMFTDRPEAQKLLNKAETSYKAVEAAATHDPLLQSRARLGLAKVYESLCKPEEALKYYEQVAASQKDTAIGKSAAADAARMKNKEQVDLLAWFAVQTPKRPAPIPGFGGGIPGLPNDLPERPDISVPSITPPSGLGLDNIGTGVPTVPTPEFPAPGTTTPPAPTTPQSKTGDTNPAEPKTEAPKADSPKSEP